MISSSNSLSRGSGMLCQVDDALLHARSGTELSDVRTELQLLSPRGYQQKSDRVERGRHCYAIKWVMQSSGTAAGFNVRLSDRDLTAQSGRVNATRASPNDSSVIFGCPPAATTTYCFPLRWTR